MMIVIDGIVYINRHSLIEVNVSIYYDWTYD